MNIYGRANDIARDFLGNPREYTAADFHLFACIHSSLEEVDRDIFGYNGETIVTRDGILAMYTFVKEFLLDLKGLSTEVYESECIQDYVLLLVMYLRHIKEEYSL